MRNNRPSLVPPALLMQLGVWGYPFMLVDGITEFKRGADGYIRAIKNVSFNEPYCAGHFPGTPIMPGVLIAEVLDQVSHYLQILNEFCNAYEQRHNAELGSTDSVRKALLTPQAYAVIQEVRKQHPIGVLASQDLRYKGVVQPGDTLVARSRLTLHDSSGFLHYKVEASVNDRVVCTGRISNFRRSLPASAFEYFDSPADSTAPSFKE